jgi:Uma2 family endonuclease
MFMATKRARWTRDELDRFPDDGNRYEVLDGELLVTPQAEFDHQAVAARLSFALYSYCAEHSIGLAIGPGKVIFGKNELQPDIEVVPGGLYRAGEKWATAPRPILVVEVLSPWGVSRRRDLSIKKDAYLQRGIDSYWVVNQEERCVHVWSSGSTEAVVKSVLTWHPDPRIAPFEITIDRLFGPATT